jgi:hypothetical protein
MTSRSRVTLVLAPPFNPFAEWSALDKDKVLVLSARSAVKAALDAALKHGVEVGHIIFDQTLSAEQFLTFLASTNHEHRADILTIDAAGEGFLSAVTPQDGRVLYRLLPADVHFYLETHYGVKEYTAPPDVSGIGSMSQQQLAVN